MMLFNSVVDTRLVLSVVRQGYATVYVTHELETARAVYFRWSLKIDRVTQGIAVWRQDLNELSYKSVHDIRPDDMVVFRANIVTFGHIGVNHGVIGVNGIGRHDETVHLATNGEDLIALYQSKGKWAVDNVGLADTALAIALSSDGAPVGHAEVLVWANGRITREFEKIREHGSSYARRNDMIALRDGKFTTVYGLYLASMGRDRLPEKVKADYQNWLRHSSAMPEPSTELVSE